MHTVIAQARSLCGWFEMGLVRISKARHGYYGEVVAGHDCEVF
jgi:hypothetical protein